jgi:succinyl-diaminopimelate desuccinylase
MHKVDECADVADILALEKVTYRLLRSYFAAQHPV